ncbi:MAG: hypothetical protein JWO03_2347 [Bacteroidetes bacterium]|nr:hypothetical protein [Bacteroidota bacterium]
MQDTKLHVLLGRFRIYELNRLQKFILSPYHNEDKDLVRLYQYILPFYKEGRSDAPDRNKIWKKIYPSLPYTNLKFARLLSDLFKKIEGFLAIEKLRQRPVDENTLILETYNDLRLGKHFTEPYLSALQKLSRQPHRDSDFHYQSFRLNAQQNSFLENKKERATEKNLMQTIESLDNFYLINKLRFCAAVLHYKHFLSVRDETILLKEILDYLQNNPPLGSPAIAVYHLILLTLKEPDDESHFAGLKQQLADHSEQLELSTQLDALDYALNYCIRKINSGQVRYQNEVLSLYKYALDKELLYDKGILSPWDYKNITTIALRNKEYKWAVSFLDKYRDKLPKADRANAYTFNQARYYFATRKFDKVLELLQGVEYSDVFYLLDSKTTLMKTYYELGEYQPLQSLKESFRILLRRKKLISEQNRANYGNFARFAMKLYRVDVKNKAQLTTLRKEIERTGNVADRGWILEKLYELSPQ